MELRIPFLRLENNCHINLVYFCTYLSFLTASIHVLFKAIALFVRFALTNVTERKKLVLLINVF